MWFSRAALNRKIHEEHKCECGKYLILFVRPVFQRRCDSPPKKKSQVFSPVLPKTTKPLTDPAWPPHKRYTPWKFNIGLNDPPQKERIVFQASLSRGELLNLGGAYPELVETKKNHEPQHQPCLPCSSSAFVLDFLHLGSSSSSQSFVQLDALMLAVGHMHLEILMPLKSYLEIGDVWRCFFCWTPNDWIRFQLSQRA